MNAIRWGLPALLFATTTALGANHRVSLGYCFDFCAEFSAGPSCWCFLPMELTIRAGDTATFHNDLGTDAASIAPYTPAHNVAADDRSFRCARGCDDDGGDGSPSSSAWTFSRTFNAPATVVYHDQASPAAGVIRVQDTPAFAIGPGITGAWFDPAQSGHGLFIEVLSDNRLLAWWFAFDPAGIEQTWFGGVGTYSGNTASITGVYQTTGGRWIPNFDSSRIVNAPWGTLTFTFTDCDRGRVDFDSVAGYGRGSMNLTRLTRPAGLTCQ